MTALIQNNYMFTTMSWGEQPKTINSARKKKEFEFLDNYCHGEAGFNRFIVVKNNLVDDVSKSWMENEFICNILTDLPGDSPYSRFSSNQKLQAEKYIKMKIEHLVNKM